MEGRQDARPWKDSTWYNGNVYEGEWRDDKRHGHGKCTFSTGDVYEGEWKDGKKHGRGKYTYSTGDVYEGEWKDNKILYGHGKTAKPTLMATRTKVNGRTARHTKPWKAYLF